jgi:hypothetical protein
MPDVGVGVRSHHTPMASASIACSGLFALAPRVQSTRRTNSVAARKVRDNLEASPAVEERARDRMPQVAACTSSTRRCGDGAPRPGNPCVIRTRLSCGGPTTAMSGTAARHGDIIQADRVVLRANPKGGWWRGRSRIDHRGANPTDARWVCAQATVKAVRPMQAVCAMKKEQVLAAVAPMVVASPAFAAAQVRRVPRPSLPST